MPGVPTMLLVAVAFSAAAAIVLARVQVTREGSAGVRRTLALGALSLLAVSATTTGAFALDANPVLVEEDPAVTERSGPEPSPEESGPAEAEEIPVLPRTTIEGAASSSIDVQLPTLAADDGAFAED